MRADWVISYSSIVAYHSQLATFYNCKPDDHWKTTLLRTILRWHIIAAFAKITSLKLKPLYFVLNAWQDGPCYWRGILTFARPIYFHKKIFGLQKRERGRNMPDRTQDGSVMANWLLGFFPLPILQLFSTASRVWNKLDVFRAQKLIHNFFHWVNWHHHHAQTQCECSWHHLLEMKTANEIWPSDSALSQIKQRKIFHDPAERGLKTRPGSDDSYGI